MQDAKQGGDPNEVGRFVGLLSTTAVMVGVLAWASETGRSGIVFGGATTLMLLAGVYAVSRSRAHVLVGLGVAIPAALTHWGFELFEARWLISLNLALMVGFLAITTWFVLDAVRARTAVDLDTVLGGVSAYLLLVLTFMYLHGFVEVTLPGSYRIMGGEIPDLATHRGRFVEFFYFSVVTVTTLGYGDIVPVRSLSRLVSSLEAFSGQLFVAIVIARLVSSYTVARRPGPGAAR